MEATDSPAEVLATTESAKPARSGKKKAKKAPRRTGEAKASRDDTNNAGDDSSTEPDDIASDTDEQTDDTTTAAPTKKKLRKNVATLLEEVASVATIPMADPKRVRSLRKRLARIDAQEATDELFGLLRGDDPHRLAAEALCTLEKLPDDRYVPALIEHLPALKRQSAEWCFCAIVRVINTRGRADDCTTLFEQSLLAAPPATRDLVVQTLEDHLTRMTPLVRESIETTLTALTGE